MDNKLRQLRECFARSSWSHEDIELLKEIIKEDDKIIMKAFVDELSEGSHEELIQRLNSENAFHCFPQYSSIWVSIYGKVSMSLHEMTRELMNKTCCDKHCCCSVWKLLYFRLTVDGRRDDKDDGGIFLRHLCVHNKSCCLDACLIYLRSLSRSCDSNTIVQEIMDTVRLKLPSNGRNFIGPTQEGIYPVVKRFIILQLMTTKQFDRTLLDKNEILEDDRIVNIFSDQDDQLLEFVQEYLKKLIEDNNLSQIHKLFHSFLDTIKFDESVLIDWISMDADTSQDCLKLILLYLKINSSEMTPDTKNCLTRLRNKLIQLKSHIPFDVRPLLRLLPEI